MTSTKSVVTKLHDFQATLLDFARNFCYNKVMHTVLPFFYLKCKKLIVLGNYVEFTLCFLKTTMLTSIPMTASRILSSTRGLEIAKY